MQNFSTAHSPGLVAQALHSLVSQIPDSTEKSNPAPAVRAKALAKSAAIKAAAISGGFTLPPGPFGMATVLPDLLAVWRIQQQLVADIAATFGRTDALTKETMVLCLFKHGGAALTQRLLARGDQDDVVVNRIANRTLQQLLEKIAVRVGQRLAAKSVSRWVPILGAVGAGAYAYYDTTHVATNAVELFSKPLQLTAPAEESAEIATTENAEVTSETAEQATTARTTTRTKRRRASTKRIPAREKPPRKGPSRARKTGSSGRQK